MTSNANVERISDIIEIEQMLARYAVGMTKDDIELVVSVFTKDGWYSAFGDRYSPTDFPRLVAAAPKGLFMTGTSLIEFDGPHTADSRPSKASGTQTLGFVDQTNQRMRIGWYTDAYERTENGWLLATRTMTFLRKSGGHDSGRAHDPTRPEPTKL